MELLSSVFEKNGLLVAFVVVGALMLLSGFLSRTLTRGRLHGSAIAIIVGLALAYWGGVVTGGDHGLADFAVFSGLGLMGGAMLRDFVFIDDVARAIVSAATGSQNGVLADIGTGVSLSIADIARIIANIYGAPSPYVTGQYRNGDVRHAACEVDIAAKQLGWTPAVSAGEGIRRLCAWIDSIDEDVTA